VEAHALTSGCIATEAQLSEDGTSTQSGQDGCGFAPPDGWETIVSTDSFGTAHEYVAWSRALRHEARALRVASLLRRTGRTPELSDVLDAAVHLTGAQRGNIQLVDGSGSLQIAAQTGFGDSFLKFFETVAAPRSACGVALELRTPVVVRDVTRSPIFSDPATLEVMLDAGCRSVESVPILRRTGDVFGVISVHFDEPLVAAGDSVTRLGPFAAALAPHVNAARRNGQGAMPGLGRDGSSTR
jgi:hypothetical protein